MSDTPLFDAYERPHRAQRGQDRTRRVIHPEPGSLDARLASSFPMPVLTTRANVIGSGIVGLSPAGLIKVMGVTCRRLPGAHRTKICFSRLAEYQVEEGSDQ